MVDEYFVIFGVEQYVVIVNCDIFLVEYRQCVMDCSFVCQVDGLIIGNVENLFGVVYFMIVWIEKDDVVVFFGLFFGNGMLIDCVCLDVQNVKYIFVNFDYNIVMWFFKYKFDFVVFNCRFDVI